MTGKNRNKYPSNDTAKLKIKWGKWCRRVRHLHANQKPKHTIPSPRVHLKWTIDLHRKCNAKKSFRDDKGENVDGPGW